MDVPVLVVMPVYNAAKYIQEAIESILDQTFYDFQFLIIDDGSTDGSGKIARSYDDPRILVWEQPNAGPGAAMNRAINYADELKIPYLARIDADDISLPDRLEKQIHLLQKFPKAAACSCNCYYIHADHGEIIGTSTVSTSPWLVQWEVFHGLRGMIQGGCMFRTQPLAKMDGYRSQFPQAEDTDVFIRLGENFDLINAKDFLHKIRLRPDSLSVKDARKNILYHIYALDCRDRRRNGVPEQDFTSFKKAPGLLVKYKLWREVTVLKLWRTGMGRGGFINVLAAGLVDPRRAIIRFLRKIFVS